MRPLLEKLKQLVHHMEKRESGARVPIHQGAYLAFGERVVVGTARDLSLGGVFFETRVRQGEPPRHPPLAVGAYGEICRMDSQATVPVRVTWVRDEGHPHGPGVGLAFVSAA